MLHIKNINGTIMYSLDTQSMKSPRVPMNGIPPVPKIKNDKKMGFQHWYERYGHIINNLVGEYIMAANMFESENYIIKFRVSELEKKLAKWIYMSSSNSRIGSA